MASPSGVTGRGALSLRTILIVLGCAALIYVALIALFVVWRITPVTTQLLQQSSGVALEYDQTHRRAERLDSTITDLWRVLGVTRVGRRSVETLEAHRRVLQDMEDSSRTLERLTMPADARSELRAVLANGAESETRLRITMLGAVAALELADVPLAERLLRRADSLDTPFNAHLAEATKVALREVQHEESNLADMARTTSRLLWVWLAIGALALPLMLMFLRRRLYEPLGALDRGLERVAEGDLNVALVSPRDDEAGRLMEHFNSMTAVLRQRALEAQERAILETAARTRSILDSALDAVVVIDARGMVREWNPQAETVFGWTRDEMIGQRLSDTIIPQAFRAAHSAGLARYPDVGPGNVLNKRIEVVGLRRDGSSIALEVAITPLERNGDVEFSAFIRDITERQRAQEALEASEERYRAAFEQAAVGMTETAVGGRFVRVNRAFVEITGRSAESLLQLTTAAITHPEDVPRDEEAARRLLNGDALSLQREKRYLRPDGSIAWVSIASALIRNPGGEPGYFLTIARDVTEQKRLEEDLRRAQKMDAVGRLAGGIAHDFNNLLAAIIGYADLMQYSDEASSEIKEDARSIVTSAKRGSDLAKNLLTLARRNPVKLEVVNLEHLIREVSGIVSRTFDRRISLRLDLRAPRPTISGDRSELSSALLNMALNARDAMPEGGTLTFATSEARLDAWFWRGRAEESAPGEYVVVTVRDTGTGMSDETRARVFEPFFTTKDAGKGTGLGLAMVYGTVLAHRGLIDVASTPGQGTAFTLYLPCGTGVHRDSGEHAVQPVIGTGRILLADDEDAVRTSTARMLRGLGYHVDAVTNGEEAAEHVRQSSQPYDLVVVDGNMPRLAGRDAAVQIRAMDPTLPVLLVSGYLEQAIGDDAERASVFAGIVAKPFTLLELSRVVASHLRRGSAENGE
ncbi:MAG: PAS domain S-box protein [Gemmatimonadaceae bacterium]